jgi:gamma-glutamyltranspeptidase/glutathione hydrolase
MTLADLAAYSGEWVTPATTYYQGEQVYELPPPSQGWGTVEMLNILSQCIGSVYPGETLASLGPQDPRYWHMLVESKKLAYADLYNYNGDPDQNPGLLNLVYNQLTTPAYAATLCGRISPSHAAPAAPGSATAGGDTTVASVADRWGNMVSWVNSNYDSFGSGISIRGYGFVLHNRGGLFTLNPSSPNVIAPNKRPYNTLMAGFGAGDGGNLMTLGLMGGDMQAQGHAQMFVNLVDLGANLQASTDLARFYHNQVPNVLELESTLYNMPVGSSTMGAVLANTYGHHVESVNGSAVGGYQSILFTPSADDSADQDHSNGDQPIAGFYRAGLDHRKDGEAVGW